MDKESLIEFSGIFHDRHREDEFIAHSWKQYSKSLRTPLFLLGSFILIGGYLDYNWYQFSAHFFIFGAIRLVVTSAAFYVAFKSTADVKPKYFDLWVGILQLLILMLWFAIFYDRKFFNDAGITSESFFTVLFVTYPFLVFYVIRGRVLFSLLNSLLAISAYLLIIAIRPEMEVQYRITELLVFTFFIYFSFILQRKLNTEERMRFSYEEKQVESFLLAKKESEEKSRFIAATSHDLRQPLHALSLHMDLLDERLSSDKQHHELLRHARESVSSLNELLIALLDISKLDAKAIEIDRKHFYVDELLLRIFSTYSKLAEAKGLVLRLHNRHLVVDTDVIMLERAIGNLVSNAVQHCSTGKVLLSCRQKGKMIDIEVWDQGLGIPSHELESIFTEYHQLENSPSERRSGLGLGLAIVKRIAGALNYKLNVQSQQGRGSRFSLRVPMGDADLVVPAVDINTRGALSLQGTKVVLIDDEVQVRHAMKLLLDSWGCESIIAENRQDLFNQLDVDNVPDVIISDCNLPHNVVGDHLVEEVRQFYSRPIPGMLITGDTTTKQSDYGESDDILLLYKPMQAAQLRLALSRLVQNEHSV